MMYLFTMSMLLILGVCDLSTAESDVPDEASLKTFLVSKYDRTVASELPLHLTCSIAPVKLIDVNPDKGLITVDLWIIYKWQDHRLGWNTNDYRAINREIILSREKVFLPDMQLQNGLVTEVLSNPEVLVFPNGTTFYVPYLRAEVYCDLPSRPFDKHICDVRIGPWARSTTRITIDSVNVESFGLQPGGRCTIDESKAKVTTQTYDCCPGEYQTVVLSLNISCLAPDTQLPVL